MVLGGADDRQAPPRPERHSHRPVLGGGRSPRTCAAVLRRLRPGLLPAPGILSRLLERRIVLAADGRQRNAVDVHRGPCALLRRRLVEDVPYVVAVVELDEGPRMLADLVELDMERLSIGDRVEVVFEDRPEGVTLPVFRWCRGDRPGPANSRCPVGGRRIGSVLLAMRASCCQFRCNRVCVNRGRHVVTDIEYGICGRCVRGGLANIPTGWCWTSTVVCGPGQSWPKRLTVWPEGWPRPG